MTWRDYRPPSVDGDSTRFKDSLKMLSKRLGMSSPEATAAIFDGWEDLVGPDLGRITAPESLINKVLTVTVVDSVWISRLKWMAPKLITTINTKVATDAVDRIELKIRS